MKSKGFTLIELLVVIAIISLLSSIILANINSARSKARDARRRVEINQIANALELFYDAHGGYPNDTVNGWEELCITSPSDLAQVVSEGYISKIPCDPTNSGAYKYYFDPEGYPTSPAPSGYLNAYCLWTNLEGGTVFGKLGGAYVGCPGT